MKSKTIFGIVVVVSFIVLSIFSVNLNNKYENGEKLLSLCLLQSLPTANAECEYKLNEECEFKCDSTPNETCSGEATIDGRKLRVTCDGKEVEC